jgi:23S rRNA-/tRNA-specific pseudouridylate synthase
MKEHRHPARAGHPTGPDQRSAPRHIRSPSVEIIHHDNDLILVNKPAGTWLTGGPDERPGVIEQLAGQGIISGDDQELHPACLLEPDASGLLALARTKDLADRMPDQLADHTLELRFLAIVRGPVATESGTIDRPIRQNARRRGPPCIDDQNGMTAVTDWRLLDAFIGFALLECSPRTAVEGQVRLHLESAGMPLAVDPIRGGAACLMLSSFKAGYRPSRRRPERPLIQRLSLHASSIAFQHPATGEPMLSQAQPPKDFRAALHQLDRFGRLPKA